MAINFDLAWVTQAFPDINGLALVGQGAQKAVYRGQHKTHGPVALKLFDMRADAERVAREVLAPTRIKSPCVPRTFANGRVTHEGSLACWVLEELVDFPTLRALLPAGVSAIVILCTARDILAAIATLEPAKVVHRDVKPDNIIVSTTDNRAWLVDFGISRFLDLQSITATANAFGLGTWGYCAPEQFRNRKREIDSRADLFSLGVTLYEVLEGVNPLVVGARDFGEVIYRTENQPLPKPTRKVEKTGAFQDLIYAMSRPRRTHRPMTAKEANDWMLEILKENGL